MAKAPEKPGTDEAAPPNKKGKLLMILVIALLLVLIIVAGGIGTLLLLKKDKSADDASAAAAPAAATGPIAGTIDLSKPPTFVPLDAFTVNLRRDEGDHYLQIVMSVRVSDAKIGDSLKAFMPEIRHRINLLLSSKLPSELAITEGREALAREITLQINDALGFPALPLANGGLQPISNGPVQAVLFSSFIIQ